MDAVRLKRPRMDMSMSGGQYDGDDADEGDANDDEDDARRDADE